MSNLKEILEKISKAKINARYKKNLPDTISCIMKTNPNYINVVFKENLEYSRLERISKKFGFKFEKKLLKNEIKCDGCSKCLMRNKLDIECVLYTKSEPTYTIYLSKFFGIIKKTVAEIENEKFMVHNIKLSYKILEQYIYEKEQEDMYDLLR